MINEIIDLTKILKDCPKGWQFWSDDYGKVEFFCIDTSLQHSIRVIRPDGNSVYYTKEGWYDINFPASCLLWPSKDCRDWSKFSAPWYKKESKKFDPKTLRPFDKVLVRSENVFNWNCSLFSNIDDFSSKYPFTCLGLCYKFCIPYNDETKHLIGTTNEAPEFYRYWEE